MIALVYPTLIAGYGPFQTFQAACWCERPGLWLVSVIATNVQSGQMRHTEPLQPAIKLSLCSIKLYGTALYVSHRCDITSHHITSHHITSHHITSHHITSHHITSHHITSHHITSHHSNRFQAVKLLPVDYLLSAIYVSLFHQNKRQRCIQRALFAS